jgi:proteasome lid subunit RPN8/RPN11
VYHSHPDAPAIPSRYDGRNAVPYLLYMIVSLNDRTVFEPRLWRIFSDGWRSVTLTAANLRGVPHS